MEIDLAYMALLNRRSISEPLKQTARMDIRSVSHTGVLRSTVLLALKRLLGRAVVLTETVIPVDPVVSTDTVAPDGIAVLAPTVDTVMHLDTHLAWYGVASTWLLRTAGGSPAAAATFQGEVLCFQSHKLLFQSIPRTSSAGILACRVVCVTSCPSVCRSIYQSAFPLACTSVCLVAQTSPTPMTKYTGLEGSQSRNRSRV